MYNAYGAELRKCRRIKLDAGSKFTRQPLKLVLITDKGEQMSAVNKQSVTNGESLTVSIATVDFNQQLIDGLGLRFALDGGFDFLSSFSRAVTEAQHCFVSILDD